MDIIKSPSKHELDKIQAILEAEINTEIKDVWASLDPHYILVKMDNEVAGVASLNTSLGLELYKLYVAPKYRKRGVANQLLNHIINEFKPEHDQLFVEVTSDSVDFWKNVTAALSINTFDSNKFCINLNG